jgi:hypothetical protein
MFDFVIAVSGVLPYEWERFLFLNYFLLAYIDRMRGFHCDNSMDVYRVL